MVKNGKKNVGWKEYLVFLLSMALLFTFSASVYATDDVTYGSMDEISYDDIDDVAYDDADDMIYYEEDVAIYNDEDDVIYDDMDDVIYDETYDTLLESMSAAHFSSAEANAALPSPFNEIIPKNSPELAGIIAFADGQATGYGRNGKFLTPISAPASGSIPISTRAGLAAIRLNDQNVKYHLVNDIDLSGSGWVPIGNSISNSFRGTFDGQGYVIRNMPIMGTYQYAGLFGYASSTSEIKNVGLEGSYIWVSSSSTVYAGGICGYKSANSSPISNCYSTGNVSTSGTTGFSYVGGICGYSNNPISNCYHVGNVSPSSAGIIYAGGICGRNFYNLGIISNCYHVGNVLASSSGSSTYVGGIYGENYASVLNCYNSGDVSASGSGSVISIAGGIGGTISGSNGSSSISNCYNTGDVSAPNSAGGISGNGSNMSNCYNTGDVSADYAGGICATSGYSSIIDNCYNTGNVSATNSVGGICSGLTSLNVSSIINCYNSGDVSAYSSNTNTFAGGICGTISGSNSSSKSISNCYNTGNVSVSASGSSLLAGGICGSISGSGNGCSISNCYNSGDVSSFSTSPTLSGSYAGGIFGGGSGSVSNCFNTGTIYAESTSANSGGICGYKTSDSILNCYNIGAVHSNSTIAAFSGGICGYSGNSSTITKNCVSLSLDISAKTSGTTNSAHSYLIGYTSIANSQKENNLAVIGINSNITNDADRLISAADSRSQTTYVMLGWDFANVWEMVTGYAYPQLKGLPPVYVVPKTPVPTVLSGTFRYPGTYPSGTEAKDKDDFSAIYHYSDEYFLGDAKTYNPHLATMSLCLELSTWTSHDANSAKLGWSANTATKNVRELLTGTGGIGFQQFEYNSFWNSPPTQNSIGAVAANKKIIEPSHNEYTLIALAIRGGGYYGEWASNFTMGASGQHQGFATAKENVLSFLSQYITNKGITGNIKLWVVGYSRGGATANLVAGALTTGHTLLPNVTLAANNIYAYTFEAPQGAIIDQTAGVYTNIHNIINPNDIVPLVAPSAWGFGRYNGSSKPLPSALLSDNFDSEKSAMLTEYYKLSGTSLIGYKIDEYTRKFDIQTATLWGLTTSLVVVTVVADRGYPQIDLLRDFVNDLSSESIGSRATYVSNLQSGIEEMMRFNNNYYAGEEKEDWLEKVFAKFTLDEIAYIISPIDNLNPFYSDAARINDIWNRLNATFTKHCNELGIEISQLFVNSTLKVLADYIFHHPVHFTKLVDNIARGSVAQAHIPEVCLAWLRSQDTYYNPNALPSSSSTTSRIMRINCPVDVNVYNSSNNLVASIINDVPQEVGCSMLCFVNENDEKIIYLPANGAYRIDMKATGAGKMTYSINEWSIISGHVERVINYYEVPLTSGATFTGVVPAFASDEWSDAVGGSSTTYQLLNSSNVEIPAGEDIKGSSVESCHYKVTVESENENGLARGSGSFLKGTFAKVQAIPVTGSSFLGWYNSGVLASTEAEYRFAVTEDTTLTARFTEVETAGIPVSNIGELREALAGVSPGVPTVIALTGDIIISDGLGEIVIPAGAYVTLTGVGGGSHTIDANQLSRVIYVKGGASLTAKDIGITGGKVNSSQRGGGVYVESGAAFTMEGGEITGGTADFGGGVCNFGEFTMLGGEISGNTANDGGGVYNHIKATFTMEGGKISGNTAADGGGGGVCNYDTFIMKGGEISGNTAIATGGGVCNHATFIIEGGEISGNTARVGSGIYNFCEIMMLGGKISGNIAATSFGGGVYNNATFTMENGEISGNTALRGGGVYSAGNNANFTMKGGEISGNTASLGGGVYCHLNATFTKEGGEIVRNTRDDLYNP